MYGGFTLLQKLTQHFKANFIAVTFYEITLIITLCFLQKFFSFCILSVNNVGDLGSIPGLGRSPGEGNGNPLQYSCLEISMDRGAWQATVHGVAKSWT